MYRSTLEHFAFGSMLRLAYDKAENHGGSHVIEILLILDRSCEAFRMEAAVGFHGVRRSPMIQRTNGRTNV